jgi:hypothetical protein
VQLARLLHLSSRGPKGCTCGHEANAHEHYRRGTDCAMCSCPKFRAGSSTKAAPKGDGHDGRGEQARAA